jgi:hypothetical protein
MSSPVPPTVLPNRTSGDRDATETTQREIGRNATTSVNREVAVLEAGQSTLVLLNRTSGDRDANQPQETTKREIGRNATTTVNRGEAG